MEPRLRNLGSRSWPPYGELMPPNQDPADAHGKGARNIESRIWVCALTLHGEIHNRLNRAFLREFGITLAKFDVLAQLDRFDEGLSQGRLSQFLKVTGGNVTGLVRRLLADGLITREMSPTDRRSFIVRLTPQGAATFQAARIRHDELLREWFGALPPDELKSALASFRLLYHHVQAPLGGSTRT